MIQVDVSKCMHCGACVGTCPVNAMFLNDATLEVYDNCIDCGLCVKVCPVAALTMIKGR